MKILVAGSSGYFAGILIPRLLEAGHEVIGVDLLENRKLPIETLSLDLQNADELLSKTINHQIDVIVNLATQIDFAVLNQQDLYKNNVVSNTNLLTLAKSKGVKNYIYTSSNSIFLGLNNPIIRHDDPPTPIDDYGRSKVECEKNIRRVSGLMNFQIIRCPNIIDAGRVGMLSVLYDILKNDATLWVIGDGGIRHQTLYAQDLATFILESLNLSTSNIVNLGSEGIPTLREMYEDLAKRVGSRSKVRSVPSWLVLPLMKLAYKLNLSPLGPYQFRMLTRSFAFETDWRSLPIEWRPSKSNTDMLEIAYHYYMNATVVENQTLSANKSSATRGLARILTRIKL